MTDAMLDGDFENLFVLWLEWVQNGGIADEDSIEFAHSPTHSGKTDTTSPTGADCYAKVDANGELIALPVTNYNQAGSLKGWVNQVALAATGNKYIEFQVLGTRAAEPAKTLHYRWRLDASALPADTDDDKYIDMGTALLVGTWVEFSRNLYDDWVGKFISVAELIENVICASFGELDGPSSYGQIVYWDDILLDYIGQIGSRKAFRSKPAFLEM